MIIKPKKISRGSTVGIIAPAGPPNPERLKKGKIFLEHRGYRVKIFPQVRKKIGYLSGDDRSRAEAINNAFADEEIDAVLCARGGYGSLRLLPYIDFKTIGSHPKIFIGYSDITVLLLSIFTKALLVTFHGPMTAIEFGRKPKPYTIGGFYRAIEGAVPLGKVEKPAGYRLERICGGRAKGRIVGGNLCLMSKLIGTGMLPSFKNRIVFFEDTEEEPYRIDGYLSQLFQTTDFGKASGYIIGEFTRTESKYGASAGWTVRNVVKDYFATIGKPCVYGFPCGHGREKITIPIGINVMFDADEKSLVFEEAGVE